MSNELIPLKDIQGMAQAIAASKMFGTMTAEGALALMLVAQAQGKHPATVAMDYHIIQNKPALKADTMLGRYQQAGGSVKWIQMTDECVEAEFTHPQAGTVKISWDINRAKQAQLGSNGMWSKYPRQMLRARVISEGVRASFPAVLGGMYTPEEVEDMPTIETKTTVSVVDEKKPLQQLASEVLSPRDVFLDLYAKIKGNVHPTLAEYAGNVKSGNIIPTKDKIEKLEHIIKTQTGA